MKWLRQSIHRIRNISAEGWLALGFSSFVFSPLLGALCILGVAMKDWSQQFRHYARQTDCQILGIVTLGLGLSTLLAGNPGEASLGLFHFLPYFVVFVALRSHLRSITQLRRFAWILVLGVIPINLIGCGQLFWGWAGPVSLPPFIDWSLMATGNPAGRMSSVFAYANVFANYLIMVWPLILGLGIETLRYCSEESRNSRLHVQRNPKQARIPLFWQRSGLKLGLLVMSCGTTILALILTNSRNAWGIAMLMVLGYALYWGWYWLIAAWGVLTATILGAAFAPLPLRMPLQNVVPAFFWARLNDQLYPDRPVEQLRRTQWEFAQSMAQQHPLTGWGLRSFSELYEAKTGLLLGHPHSLYWMLAAETGWITTGLFMGWVGSSIWRAIHRLGRLPYRSDCQFVGVMFLSAFLATSLFHTLDVPFFDLRINLLGWLTLAAVVGYQPKAQTTEHPENP